jgi:hypothetical protein
VYSSLADSDHGVWSYIVKTVKMQIAVYWTVAQYCPVSGGQHSEGKLYQHSHTESEGQRFRLALSAQLTRLLYAVT